MKARMPGNLEAGGVSKCKSHDTCPYISFLPPMGKMSILSVGIAEMVELWAVNSQVSGISDLLLCSVLL